MRSGDPEYVYRAACCRYGLTPCSTVTSHLADQHLQLDHHGIGEGQAKALALALVVSDKLHVHGYLGYGWDIPCYSSLVNRNLNA